MRPILLLLMLLSAQGFFAAQTGAQTRPRSCPAVTVHDDAGYAVEGSVCAGSITFTAELGTTTQSDLPAFNWKVSRGKILEGQGTRTIKVSAWEIGADVTATVEVGGADGLGAECSRSATAKVRVTECLCPKILISCPTELSSYDGTAKVSVSIANAGPLKRPEYNWLVSPGKIIAGQGTPEIIIDRTGTGRQTIIATVEVGGLPPECEKVRSCTFAVSMPPPRPQPGKFAEYGGVSWINEKTRLNNFGNRLEREPGAQAYVIAYGPRGVGQHLARVKKFLVENPGIEPDRITLMNGGYNRKTKVELWIGPPGAAAPKPDPNF